MAEFCLDCWNCFHNSELQKEDIAVFREYARCEYCGEMKHVVITLRGDWKESGSKEEA